MVLGGYNGSYDEAWLTLNDSGLYDKNGYQRLTTGNTNDPWSTDGSNDIWSSGVSASATRSLSCCKRRQSGSTAGRIHFITWTPSAALRRCQR